MSVNGIQGYSQLEAYSVYNQKAKTTEAKDTKAEETTASESSAIESDVAAVYEKSEEASEKVTEKTYTRNTALVEQMKADQEKLQNQLLSYVQESLMGQGNAIATSDDIWKFLASGNFTVDEAARAEAQKSIEEGGYWSAESTSDRIVEFAKALTGGDPSQIEKMRDAIDKGFKEATKAWGRDLPSITNDTYDLIQKKLDAWANGDDEAKAANDAVTATTEVVG